MKAIVYEQYGSPDVLQLKEVEKPTPKDDEVLIKVYAAAANAADKYLLAGKPIVARFEFGLFKPKKNILGADVAGKVEAIGKNVKRFQVDDEIFGDLSACGFGGFAEYVCASEDTLVLKPETLSFEDAAAIPMSAVTALQALRDQGQIQAGQKVLIYGASGGVGTFAVQIAKSFGAEVTAVCSTGKIDMVRSLGADHVIDYTKEDFSQNRERYDLILAANGDHSIFKYKGLLSPQGTYVVSGGSMTQIFQAMLLGPLISKFGSHNMRNVLAVPKANDLAFVKELIESGKVVPVIDKRYPLSQVPDALRYLGEGHAKGKIIITVEHDE